MTRKYFGTDGIRGTVGQPPITPDFVLRLAHAVRRSCEIIGTPAPVASVMNLIERYEEQVNTLVSDDEDLAAYVERLETMTDNGMSIDDEVDDGQLQFDFATDSGEDEADAATLMDEVEQFLREQGDGK